MDQRERKTSLRRFFGRALMLSLCLVAGAVDAVPSMGRQTGYACGRCHTVFPELTAFGRQFKLGAFAESSAKWDEKSWLERLPVSGVLQISRTTTSSNTAGGVDPVVDLPADRQVIGQVAGVYYGGKITDNSGALIQYSWDGIEKRWGMEMFDARYARTASIGGRELAFGATLNNNPTLSDIYNSTPAWGFPNTETAAPQPAAGALIDMRLASQVAGIGVYGLWNELVYAEVASYGAARDSGLFRLLSRGVPKDRLLDGRAPYWRFALQRESAPHSFSVGTYGMVADVFSDAADPSLGSDRFRDIAFDGFYQYNGGGHIVSVGATRIRERQEWRSNFARGATSNEVDTLTTFRASLRYAYQRKWGGVLQYFQMRGDADPVLYNTGDALNGSANGSPNTKGYAAELNYLPLQNIKLALRYTRYAEFNGASRDYMPGRNASDNDNLYLLMWLMF